MEQGNLVARLRAQFARHGDTHWCAYVDGRPGRLTEQRLGFAELDDHAVRRASWLSGTGPGTDGLGNGVLLMYPAGLEFLSTFLGCLYAGVPAVPAPLPQTDPRALDRALRIIKDAGVTLVLTDSAHTELLHGWLADEGMDGQVRCLATDRLELPAAPGWTGPELGPDSVAYLQYTSGSTSEPRGVVLTHRNLLHNQREIAGLLGFPEDGTLAGWLPHYHDMGLIGQLLHPLYAGMNLAFASPVSFVMRPSLWLEMISRYRATVTVAPDFGYQLCVRRCTDQQLEGLDLSSLRHALTGAEPVRPSTLRAVSERFAAYGFDPGVQVPVYGMAEATLLVSGTARPSGASVRRFDPAGLEAHRAIDSDTGPELVSCGAPIDLDLRIIDPETLGELPERRIGEIWLAGASVAAGHWQNEQSTEAVFGARTGSGAGPFLRTGDLGFLLEGELFVTGRCKDVVIVNGRNLYPQDIEETARVHPGSGATAAFGVDTGREHVVVVQEIREERLDGLEPAELAALVLTEVTRSYGLHTVNVLLVPRGGVERTTSGKVRRGRMRELLLAGSVSPVHAELADDLAELLAPAAG